MESLSRITNYTYIQNSSFHIVNNENYVMSCYLTSDWLQKLINSEDPPNGVDWLEFTPFIWFENIMWSHKSFLKLNKQEILIIETSTQFEKCNQILIFGKLMSRPVTFFLLSILIKALKVLNFNTFCNFELILPHLLKMKKLRKKYELIYHHATSCSICSKN